jgi:hypothetical protein
MRNHEEYSDDAEALLARVRAFCFPGGEKAARQVQAVKITQRGEIRGSPGAKWTPFTAEEVIEATRSCFRWNARIGGSIRPLTVTDAYENGRGRLVLKLGGVVPLKKIEGPEADAGELQRYLGSVGLCPPIVLNHSSLEWKVTGPLTLQLRDRWDPTGTSVDLEISEQGCLLRCRAHRPRMAGKKFVLTPWSGEVTNYREWEGIRIASLVQAQWRLAEEPFTYIRSEVVSVTLRR